MTPALQRALAARAEADQLSARAEAAEAKFTAARECDSETWLDLEDKMATAWVAACKAQEAADYLMAVALSEHGQ